MITKVIVTLALSVLAGVLYRMGGVGKPYNSKVRDMGVPTVMLAVMAVWGMFHWSLVLCWGMTFGALTTYWDFVNKLLPVADKGKEYWWNWALHGFFVALAMFPLAIAYSAWLEFWIRMGLVSVIVTVWSVSFSNVMWEEWGRGFWITVTLPILAV